MGGGRYWEVVVIGRWPLLGGGRYWEVAVIGRWPLLGGGRYWEVAVIGRWSLLGGGRYWEVAVIGRWPLLGGGRYWEVAVIGRWPLLGGGRYWEVAVIVRWPLLGGGRYSEVYYKFSLCVRTQISKECFLVRCKMNQSYFSGFPAKIFGLAHLYGRFWRGNSFIFFHLGLRQVAAKRYWEVAAIRRFAM